MEGLHGFEQLPQDLGAQGGRLLFELVVDLKISPSDAAATSYHEALGRNTLPTARY